MTSSNFEFGKKVVGWSGLGSCRLQLVAAVSRPDAPVALQKRTKGVASLQSSGSNSHVNHSGKLAFSLEFSVELFYVQVDAVDAENKGQTLVKVSAADNNNKMTTR